MALAGGVDNLGYNTESELLPEEWPSRAEAYVPIARDPRIKSIEPLDGSNQMMQFFELARVTIPVMGMGQEWSTLVSMGWGFPWESWQARQHAAFQGSPSYRVDVAGAYHPSFSNLCTGITLAYDKALLSEEDFENMAGWLCSAPLPAEEANRVTTKYVIAFLKTHLCLLQGYQNILTPGYVLMNELGLEFFVTAEVLARVRLLGSEFLLPGEEGWLQLELREAVTAIRGDRYILRRPSPGETLGGGIIVDPHPRQRHKRFADDLIARLEGLKGRLQRFCCNR